MNPQLRVVVVFFSSILLILAASVAADDAYPSMYGDESCGPGDLVAPPRREVYGNGRIFDITHRYHPDMPTFETDEGIGQFLWIVRRMKNGSIANISEMKMQTHTGTHLDAPGHFYDHFFDAGFDVDTLDLDILNGPALLVDMPRDSNITADAMKLLQIPKGVRRVLFRTLNTDRRLMFKKEFDSTYVGFTKDGAQWLVDNTDIKLVGVDYLSAASYDHLSPSHFVFLKNAILGIKMGLRFVVKTGNVD